MRKQFTDSANSQSDFLQQIVDGSNLTRQTITSSGGNGYVFKPAGTGYDVSILYADGTHESITINDITDFDILSSFGSEFQNFGEFLNDVSDSMDFNSCISSVCSLFSQAPNVSVTDLINYIDKNVNSYNDSVQQLETLLISNAQSGKVSQWTFLNILQHVFQDGRTSESGIAMDNTSAYFVKNAVSTIIVNVIFQALSTIITAVLTMINAVLGLIVSAISALVGALIKGIKSAVRTGVTVKDYDSNTNYFDGCACAAAVDIGGPIHIPGVGDHFGKAALFEIGPYDFYAWSSDDSYNVGEYTDRVRSYNVNGFLAMSLHPLRTVQKLINNSAGVTFTSSGMNNFLSVSTGSFTGAIYSLIDDSCYLTTAEQMALMYESASTLNAYGLFNRCFGSFMSLVLEQNQTYRFEAETYDQLPASSINVNNCERIAISWLAKAINCYNVFGNLDTWFNVFASSGDKLTSLMIATLNIYNDSFVGAGDATSGWFWNRKSNITIIDNGVYSQSVKKYNHPLGCITTSSSSSKIFLSPDAYTIVDSIPSSRTWSFQNATWAQIALAVGLVTVISASIVVATTVGRVKLKKYAMKKQLSEYSKLQTARNNYIDKDTGKVLDDPTGENFNALRKAIRRYNRLGKVFGWGSYDYVNNWNDSSAASSSSDVINSENTGLASSDLVSKLQDLTIGRINGEDNVDNTTLNEGVGTVGGKVNTLSQTVSGLVRNVSDISNKTESVRNDISTLSGSVSDISNKTENVRNDISTLSGTVQNIINDINTINTKLNALSLLITG
jgi:methyl-accepting chemotaxis protein